MNRLRISIFTKLMLLCSIFLITLVFFIAFLLYSQEVNFKYNQLNQVYVNILSLTKDRIEFSKNRNFNLIGVIKQYISVNDSILKQNIGDADVVNFRYEQKLFSAKINELVELYQERGLNENEGIEGDFRNDIHTIEEILYKTYDNDLLVELLQARRREKDFLLRGSNNYVTNVNSFIASLKDKVSEKSYDEAKIKKINQLADNYLISFKKFVNVLQRISILEKDIENEEQKLNTIITTISLKQENKYNQIQNLQIVLSFVSLFSCFFAAVVLSKTLTRPILELVKASQYIIEGNYAHSVSVNSNDEIAELANMFNKMSGKINNSIQLLDHQNKNLEQIVEQRTNELKEEIQRKNETEAKLQIAYIELENVNYEMKIALSKEKEVNELKSKFISIVSHEYRTPLTVILHSTFLIEKYSEISDLEKMRNQLWKIQKSVKDMTVLLEDILTIGKIDAGKLNVYISKFTLMNLLVEIIDEKKQISDKNQQFNLIDLSQDLKIISDSNMLSIILNNLLTNAMKYSYPQSEIIITLSDDNFNFFITVQDFGIGISENDTKHLFSPFFRGRNVGTINGTGLGLSIAKKYVEVLSGQISFESVEGEGSKFTLKIPINFESQDKNVNLIEGYLH